MKFNVHWLAAKKYQTVVIISNVNVSLVTCRLTADMYL